MPAAQVFHRMRIYRAAAPGPADPFQMRHAPRGAKLKAARTSRLNVLAEECAQKRKTGMRGRGGRGLGSLQVRFPRLSE